MLSVSIHLYKTMSLANTAEIGFKFAYIRYKILRPL